MTGVGGGSLMTPFNASGLTAAHRTLPFGTRVRVTDPKTGRSVIVTINDRGRFGRGRLIDVSLAAARSLGMIDRGVIYVETDIL
jgi:rare lipoprotein A